MYIELRGLTATRPPLFRVLSSRVSVIVRVNKVQEGAAFVVGFFVALGLSPHVSLDCLVDSLR